MPHLPTRQTLRRTSLAVFALVLAACGTGPATAQQADQPFSLEESGRFNEP